MTGSARQTFDDIAGRLDAIVAVVGRSNSSRPRRTLPMNSWRMGETILESWLSARGVTPTTRTVEGFRLLALHRQGARGDASFNACRETCRELVYHRNLVCLEPEHPDTARRLRLGAMVAKHLALFIGGKLEVAGLGEFCCSSRPLRQRDENSRPAEVA